MEFNNETLPNSLNTETATLNPKKARQYLDSRVKLAIAEEAISKPRNYSHTARKYNIALSQVQNYVKNMDPLRGTFGRKLTLHKGSTRNGTEEMEIYITELVAKYNADGRNIDYQHLVFDLLKVYPDFLVNGRKEGVYSTQEERIRGWLTRTFNRLRLSIRSPTHISQNAADYVEVYQDAVSYANIYGLLKKG
jgi:hypothetical protein